MIARQCYLMFQYWGCPRLPLLRQARPCLHSGQGHERTLVLGGSLGCPAEKIRQRYASSGHNQTCCMVYGWNERAMQARCRNRECVRRLAVLALSSLSNPTASRTTPSIISGVTARAWSDHRRPCRSCEFQLNREGADAVLREVELHVESGFVAHAADRA